MMYDRQGHAVDLDEPAPQRAERWHDPRCRGGWLITLGPDGKEDFDVRKPCLVCKPHLGRRNTPDPEPVVSERARRAIELEAQRDKYRRH